MTGPADRDVRFNRDRDRWDITPAGSRVALLNSPDRGDAERIAAAVVSNGGGGTVRVLDAEGHVLATRTIEPRFRRESS
jgi:hypothetical protein